MGFYYFTHPLRFKLFDRKVYICGNLLNEKAETEDAEAN